MSKLSDTAVAPKILSRRAALRLAFTAVPAVAVFGISSFRSAAEAAGGPVIEVIDAAYQTVAGITKPNASNTGVRRGATLTKYNGNLILTTPGQIIQNLDITGHIDVRASGCTIRNCIVRGGPDPKPGTTTPYPLIKVWNTGVTNTLIEDVEIAPSHPSVGVYGIHGFDFTARRVNIHSCTDSIVAYKQNVLVESCYVWDARWYSVDPRQSDGSHNDGTQVEGGTNLRFIGNYYDMKPQPGFTRGGNMTFCITQNAALINGLTISNNWLSGGTYATLQGSEGGKGAMRNVTITNNKFGRSTRTSTPTYSDSGNGWAILLAPKTYATANLSGNVYEDNGAPVRMQAYGS